MDILGFALNVNAERETFPSFTLLPYSKSGLDFPSQKVLKLITVRAKGHHQQSKNMTYQRNSKDVPEPTTLGSGLKCKTRMTPGKGEVVSMNNWGLSCQQESKDVSPTQSAKITYLDDLGACSLTLRKSLYGGLWKWKKPGIHRVLLQGAKVRTGSTDVASPLRNGCGLPLAANYRRIICTMYI